MGRFLKPSILFIIVILVGCTAVTTVNVGGRLGPDQKITITTGDLDRPYRSIGFTQMSRTGVWLLGFIEIMPAQLDDALTETLADEAYHRGADAVINVQFYEMQYPLLLKLLSVLAIVSPQYVVVTGELVEFIE